MRHQAHAFHGTVVHSIDSKELVVMPHALLVVNESGRIHSLQAMVTTGARIATLDGLKGQAGFSDTRPALRILEPHEFIIPGFVDAHNYAPQWGRSSMNQGVRQPDWIGDVSFPSEVPFGDMECAVGLYSACVGGSLRHGVTTAAYYGSVNRTATWLLASKCRYRGQRAVVGKWNMDRDTPGVGGDESVAASLAETRHSMERLEEKLDPEGDRLKYGITPHSACTCSPELLKGLGDLAEENPDLPIQLEYNKSEQEMARTKALFPDFDTQADLYDHYGLLTDSSILAHCTVMSEEDVNRIKEADCGVAHCPFSDMTAGDTFRAAPVRTLLDKGIKVGLGTESGHGFPSSILATMRHALMASRAREAMTGDRALTLDEVFHMATLGGANVCGFGKLVGNFDVGKEFDALLVDARARDSVMASVEMPDHDFPYGPVDVQDEVRERVEAEAKAAARKMFEAFVMTGDDRNIDEIYTAGQTIPAKFTRPHLYLADESDGKAWPFSDVKRIEAVRDEAREVVKDEEREAVKEEQEEPMKEEEEEAARTAERKSRRKRRKVEKKADGSRDRKRRAAEELVQQGEDISAPGGEEANARDEEEEAASKAGGKSRKKKMVKEADGSRKRKRQAAEAPIQQEEQDSPTQAEAEHGHQEVEEAVRFGEEQAGRKGDKKSRKRKRQIEREADGSRKRKSNKTPQKESLPAEPKVVESVKMYVVQRMEIVPPVEERGEETAVKEEEKENSVEEEGEETLVQEEEVDVEKKERKEEVLIQGGRGERRISPTCKQM